MGSVDASRLAESGAGAVTTNGPAHSAAISAQQDMSIRLIGSVRDGK